MCEWFAYINECTPCVCMSGVRGSQRGRGVTRDSYGPPCVCWELDLGPLQRAVSALSHKDTRPQPGARNVTGFWAGEMTWLVECLLHKCGDHSLVPKHHVKKTQGLNAVLARWAAEAACWPADLHSR